MHLKLPEQLERFAQHQVQRGYYESVSEFIRDAIRTKMQEDQLKKLEDFKVALAPAEYDLKQGAGVEFSEALMDDMDAVATDNAAQGKPIDNPDALPE